MKLASCSLLAAITVVGAMSAPVAAQNRPYGDEALTPDVDQYLSAPNNVTDYPAAEVRAVPGAKARRAIAVAERREAYNGLQLAVRDSESEMLDSDAMTEALEEEKAAFMELELARAAALSELSKDAEYQAHRAAHESLGKQIADFNHARRDDGISSQVVTLATNKLDFAKEQRRRESEVLARSDDYREARRRLVVARAEINAIQKEWRKQIKTDPQLVEARQKHMLAKIAHLAAEAYLEGVVEARNIALRYAEYLHRYNPYQVAHYPYYGHDVFSGYYR